MEGHGTGVEGGMEGREVRTDGIVAKAWRRVDLLRLEGVVHRLDELLVRSCWGAALLVEHRKDALLLVIEQLDLRRVVWVFDVVALDALTVVLDLLALDERIHEELLQPLVGEVDAKLLKTSDTG